MERGSGCGAAQPAHRMHHDKEVEEQVQHKETSRASATEILQVDRSPEGIINRVSNGVSGKNTNQGHATNVT